MADEFEIFSNKRPDRVYLSKAFPEYISFDSTESRKLRIVSKVLDSPVQHEFAKVKNEVVLRRTPGNRQEIKAVFWEDSREVKSLTVQKFSAESGNPHQKRSFTLNGDEVEQLFNFLRFLQYIELNSEDKQRFDDEMVNEWLLSEHEKRNYFISNLDLVAEIAEHQVTKSDIIALGYRKQQLQVFEQLINDDDYFDQKMTEWKVRGPEAVWQRFFENNPWIFGYGLQYIFTSNLDNVKLEQVTSGYNLQQSGKRVDALIKTRGYVSSLCFVEIKTHRTPLLYDREPYRPDCWRVSNELAGSVAQIQKTVQRAVKELHTKLESTDDRGLPTGEVTFMYQPKSYVVVGRLQEFVINDRVNEQKFSSFELFRRNIVNPEILTFDELFERALNIVRHSESTQSSGASQQSIDSYKDGIEDIPF